MPCTIAMQREAAHGTRDPLRRPPAPRPCDRGTCQVAGCVVHNCHSSRRAFRDRSELCTKGNHGVQEGEVESPDGQTRPGNAECRPGRPARRCNCSRCRWCCRTRPCPYPLRSLPRRMPPAFASASRPPPWHCLHCCTRRAHAISCRRTLARRSDVYALPCSNASPDTLIPRVCPHRAPEEIDKNHWVDTRNRSRGHD